MRCLPVHAVVAIPHGTARGINFKQLIDGFQSIENARIIHSAQPLTYQLQEVNCNLLIGWQIETLCAVLDQHMLDQGAFVHQHIVRGDAYVISRDPQFPGERRIGLQMSIPPGAHSSYQPATTQIPALRHRGRCCPQQAQRCRGSQN